MALVVAVVSFIGIHGAVALFRRHLCKLSDDGRADRPAAGPSQHFVLERRGGEQGHLAEKHRAAAGFRPIGGSLRRAR